MVRNMDLVDNTTRHDVSVTEVELHKDNIDPKNADVTNRDTDLPLMHSPLDSAPSRHLVSVTRWRRDAGPLAVRLGESRPA